MPLWSLKWEVLYSAFLLVFVFVAKRVDWRIALPLALVWGSAGIGELVFYSSMFLLGTFIGLNLESSVSFLEQRAGLPSLLFISGLILVAVSNYLQAWVHIPFSGNLGILVSLIGIAGLVAAAENSFAGNFLRSKLVQFLGKISFSLYLVHEPVLIGLARMGGLNPWVTLSGIPVAVGFALIFYILLEKKAHVLSRKLSA
jgi:peptidoglycan/LPS O-acetylase OafA/YrhL